MRKEDYIELKEQYTILRDRKSEIMYIHCRNCIEDMPKGDSASSWARLEAIVDLKTGFLTLGCKRCEIPVVCAMMPNDIVTHMDSCGCELCRIQG